MASSQGFHLAREASRGLETGGGQGVGARATDQATTVAFISVQTPLGRPAVLVSPELLTIRVKTRTIPGKPGP